VALQIPAVIIDVKHAAGCDAVKKKFFFGEVIWNIVILVSYGGMHIRTSI
jgi:hypothetical protein